MKLKDKEITLKGPESKINIKRNQYGIPEIQGVSYRDLAYGLGFVHANDRQLQVLLTRILLQGMAAEKLAGKPELIEIDRYMRRMNFLPDPEVVIAKLTPETKEVLEAYADGFNFYLLKNKPVMEFKLLGYVPEPWTIKDSIVMPKIMGFLGLADAQGMMEKFLVQMIQKDVEEEKLKELFPYLKERIDYDLIQKISLQPPMVPEAVKWFAKLPRFMASNNWVVSGKLTESGKPILCNDPHLEVNRVPSIWQEVIMRLPDDNLIGVGLPGVPSLIIGRNKNLAWGVTFAFMDMIDYRIEQCKDGKYRRGKEWIPFNVREEERKVKKKDSIIEKVYENEHGVLEGDPFTEGYYLMMGWSAAEDCGDGDCNGSLNVASAENVKEAMKLFRMMDAGSWSWVVADKDGNIGYQMTGRMFNRPGNVSGLIPLPAWEKKYDYKGFVDKKRLPSIINPKEGFIATANQDLNHLGNADPINLPMASYRADRIAQLLKKDGKLNVDYMKEMHYDLYSLQAERFMKVLRPLLPGTKKGRILLNWDCKYSADSKGATLFESIYLSLLKVVFGDHGMGRDVIVYLMKETGLFNDYYGNFDNILLSEESAWFNGKRREDLFKEAVREGLKAKAVPYEKTRKIVFSHLLFGGQLPRFLGFPDSF